MAGEISLVVALTAALAFAWSDGTPAQGAVNTSFTDASWIRHVSDASLAGSQPTVVFPALPRLSSPPVQLLIPSLDIHRAVEQVGTNRAGVLNLPVNAWNAGWYKGGPVPGAPGDAVIEGHAGYPGQPMIFGQLVKLHPGGKIVVVLADGSRQLFIVDSVTSIPVGTAPPGMGEPYGPPRLTLITCTGHFDKNSYSYSRRLVLEATYAGTV